VGDYRVVYRLAGQDIIILAIRHRKRVYEEIEDRL
jgi:mRNA-degrading endonuclease RelE of RelBE toxin-antitoxin system